MCFPVNIAKFLRRHFLQNTAGQLLLLLNFQKQPPKVFYEKAVLENLAKFIEKCVVCKILKNNFFTEHLYNCNFTKIGHCQQFSKNLR